MNRLMKSVKKGLHGGWEIESKWRGGRWRNRSDYQGYWNTSLCNLSRGVNPIIKKGEDGKYIPTKYGIENKLHPFKKDKETLRKMRERRAEVIEMENRWRDSYTSRERWRIIEFIEFEDDNYKSQLYVINRLNYQIYYPLKLVNKD